MSNSKCNLCYFKSDLNRKELIVNGDLINEIPQLVGGALLEFIVQVKSVCSAIVRKSI